MLSSSLKVQNDLRFEEFFCDVCETGVVVILGVFKFKAEHFKSCYFCMHWPWVEQREIVCLLYEGLFLSCTVG